MSLILTVKVPEVVAKPINFMLNISNRKYIEAELFAKEVRKNKRFETMSAFVIGSLMYSEKVLAAPSNTVKITEAGNTILDICREIGYWACLIMCILEIIKSLLQGDTKGISKIIAKYLLGFGALYLMPWLFDLIKSIFA
jgi:hypothetical protein